MKGVFVTGSNTGVGKTTVAIEIVRFLSQKQDLKVRKPVETGCSDGDTANGPKDAILLSEACTQKEPLSLVCPYRFELEASAESASNKAGEGLSLEDLIKACLENTKGSFVLVEGAGGLYSPIAKMALNSDLAAALRLPLVIVIEDELGAISQALLTINAAEKSNLDVLCIVLNQISKNSLSNREAICAYTKTPVISFSLQRVKEFCLEFAKLVKDS
ncbi:MAG TPA: dethiobiotin synthase [Gammaproteobacteria bacterium]|jgi:dethiobiotin synthetase|nr:dethiobiotin synthase [Acidiferrobacteraceae bacterium]HJP12715.1 dethiobiotin synthase [Gammaproteobacteria bacterium]